MDMDLSLLQTRVIGCMLEKEITTPDQYPLSLKSLTVACNQKSNREPVMELSEVDVQAVVDELTKKRLMRDEAGFGSRVVKFKHRFCNTEFSDLQLSPQELGIICTLFLRGPQTPGELRSRTNRLCEFSDVGEVDAVLQRLSERESQPLVVRLERESGKRESRYAHLFSGPIDTSEVASGTSVVKQDHNQDHLPERDTALEQRVDALETQVAELREMLDELLA